MEYVTNKILYQLKTVFFSHMDFSNGKISYGDFAAALLEDLKEIIEVEEASLYRFDKEKETLYMEATTQPIMDEDMMADCIPWSVFDQSGSYAYFRSDPSKVLQRFRVIIPLFEEGRMTGVLALWEKAGGVFDRLGPEEGEKLARECSKILETALNISKTVNEKRRYKQLFRVTEKFHSTMKMEAVLEEIIATLQEVYPNFIYYLLISHDNDNHGNLPIKDLEYDSENAAALRAYVNGTLQLEDNTAERKCILYAPLKGKQGVYGVLQIIAPHTLSFPEEEIEFITLLANTAGSALENAQLYQQSKRLITDLQLINETSHKLNSNLRLSETMNYMKEQIMKSFQADETGLILLLPEGEVSLISGSSIFFEKEESRKYIQYLKDKIKEERESLFIGDLSIQYPNIGLEYRSIMAVPMMESSSLKGFAVVLHKEPYYFSFEMFKLLQSLIHHSSLALSNSMLREELEKMVITDHLTRLHSRNYLDEKIYQSMEQDNEGTFILIDIDDFKHVNDTYGHQIGDEILVQVAKMIQANIRDTDIGARWGGEELAIYLPKVHVSVGAVIAERLLEKVRRLSNPKITISVGVSYWCNNTEDNAKSLFKRADEALYEAKSTGKNKVLVNEGAYAPLEE